MAKPKFTPFTKELKESFGILGKTWQTSLKIVFLPIIPLLFTFPYLIVLYATLQEDQFPALNFSNIVIGVAALIGFIAFIMLLEIVRAGLFATYSLEKNIGARKALQIGTKRFPTFLYTDFLSLVYLVISMVPFFVLVFWTGNGGTDMLFSIFGSIIANLILFLAFIVFLLPLAITALWLTFTQIIVATGKNTGFHALTYSTTLVRPVIFTIFFKIVGWMIFAGIISYAVSPLPILYWLIPIIVKLWGAAYLVVLYKETKGA